MTKERLALGKAGEDIAFKKIKKLADTAGRQVPYEKLKETFITASRYEYMYWDAIYNMHTWQV